MLFCGGCYEYIFKVGSCDFWRIVSDTTFVIGGIVDMGGISELSDYNKYARLSFRINNCCRLNELNEAKSLLKSTNFDTVSYKDMLNQLIRYKEREIGSLE